MYIEQLYTNCLAQATYYLESEGEAAIIDPLRDIDAYLDKAGDRGTAIRYIFETHFHADFVSGHLDLAKATGAEIIFGPGARTNFEKTEAKDGQRFKLGKLSIEVLHTPGHTPESSSFLLYDENNKPYALFSGDTLFVGDVGRPDLLDGVMTKEQLASMMFDSLNNKIKPLPDDVILYPAHGAGSSCGKNIGPETYSTIGTQKKRNYAMQEMSREEFIRKVTDNIPAAPHYFFDDARLNKTGYGDLDELLHKGLKGLNPDAFEEAMRSGATIIDARTPNDFELGFVPGSINIGLNGQYAIWAGTLIPLEKEILIVADEGKEKEAMVRLARVGFEHLIGYLEGGIEAWRKAGKRIDMVISVEPEELELDYKHSEITVLDIRRPSEYEEAHVKDASFITLQDLPQQVRNLDRNGNYYVHCAGGYRSMIGSSILKAHGFVNVKNVHGGFSKIKSTGIPVESASKAQKV